MFIFWSDYIPSYYVSYTISVQSSSIMQYISDLTGEAQAWWPITQAAQSLKLEEVLHEGPIIKPIAPSMTVGRVRLPPRPDGGGTEAAAGDGCPVHLS
jgi:hypothetical protein